MLAILISPTKSFPLTVMLRMTNGLPSWQIPLHVPAKEAKLPSAPLFCAKSVHGSATASRAIVTGSRKNRNAFIHPPVSFLRVETPRLGGRFHLFCNYPNRVETLPVNAYESPPVALA